MLLQPDTVACIFLPCYGGHASVLKFQVATGMAYLETIPFAHRYLRARYVAIQEGPIFKVAEYGTNLAPKKIDSGKCVCLFLKPRRNTESSGM